MKQLTTTCWNCGTLQGIGNPCTICKAPIDAPIASLPACIECGRKKPVYISPCPFCNLGKGISDEKND